MFASISLPPPPPPLHAPGSMAARRDLGLYQISRPSSSSSSYDSQYYSTPPPPTTSPASFKIQVLEPPYHPPPHPAVSQPVNAPTAAAAAAPINHHLHNHNHDHRHPLPGPPPPVLGAGAKDSSQQQDQDFKPLAKSSSFSIAFLTGNDEGSDGPARPIRPRNGSLPRLFPPPPGVGTASDGERPIALPPPIDTRPHPRYSDHAYPPHHPIHHLLPPMQQQQPPQQHQQQQFPDRHHQHHHLHTTPDNHYHFHNTQIHIKRSPSPHHHSHHPSMPVPLPSPPQSFRQIPPQPDFKPEFGSDGSLSKPSAATTHQGAVPNKNFSAANGKVASGAVNGSATTSGGGGSGNGTGNGNGASGGGTVTTAPKVYKCPSEGCNKTFTRRYNLQSHMRCHS
ncbi:hypothetical protein HK104_010213, partial [Borealophlyctis nickersoniae]